MIRRVIAITAIAGSLLIGSRVALATWDWGGGPGRFGSAAAACQDMVKQNDRYKFSSVKPIYPATFPATQSCFVSIEGGDAPYSIGVVSETVSGKLEDEDKEESADTDESTASAEEEPSCVPPGERAADPWSKARIAAVSNRSTISVGMHATVTMKEELAALDKLTLPAAFSQFNGNNKQIDAMGNGGIAAWLPDSVDKKGYQPAAGLLLKPVDPKSSAIEFVTWNTGAQNKDFNASHAEYQFYNFIASRGAWLTNVKTITIDVYGLKMCAMCNADRQHLISVVAGRDPNLETKSIYKDSENGTCVVIYKVAKEEKPE